jgi:hypothetical protein
MNSRSTPYTSSNVESSEPSNQVTFGNVKRERLVLDLRNGGAPVGETNNSCNGTGKVSPDSSTFSLTSNDEIRRVDCKEKLWRSALNGRKAGLAFGIDAILSSKDGSGDGVEREQCCSIDSDDSGENNDCFNVKPFASP